MKTDWGKLYDHAKKLIQQTSPLMYGSDYEITQMCHTTDEIIMTVEGRGNYQGRQEIVFSVTEENGRLCLKQKSIGEVPEPDLSPIPESVKVGDAVYTVQRITAKIQEDGIQLGTHNAAAQLIGVARITESDFAREILIHELVHAVIAQFCDGLPLSREDNEKFTSAFARGFTQCIKDNPHIFEVSEEVKICST